MTLIITSEEYITITVDEVEWYYLTEEAVVVKKKGFNYTHTFRGKNLKVEEKK